MHNIQDSSENYLEAIYMLNKEHGTVRSIDIANHLSLSRPSVSKAMKKLEEEGHVIMHEDGELELTATGKKIGQQISERHVLLHKLLVKMGVPDHLAEEDACKLEHAMSQETSEHIKRYVQED